MGLGWKTHNNNNNNNKKKTRAKKNTILACHGSTLLWTRRDISLKQLYLERNASSFTLRGGMKPPAVCDQSASLDFICYADRMYSLYNYLSVIPALGRFWHFRHSVAVRHIVTSLLQMLASNQRYNIRHTHGDQCCDWHLVGGSCLRPCSRRDPADATTAVMEGLTTPGWGVGGSLGRSLNSGLAATLSPPAILLVGFRELGRMGLYWKVFPL